MPEADVSTLTAQTDGLSDNLPTPHIPLLAQHIHDLLHKAPQNAQLTPAEKLSEQARILADVLVAYGRFGMARTGKEKGWKTPFEEEARRHGMRFEGGKVDEYVPVAALNTLTCAALRSLLQSCLKPRREHLELLRCITTIHLAFG